MKESKRIYSTDVLAVIPEFGLRVFQNVSGADLRNIIIKLPSSSPAYKPE